MRFEARTASSAVYVLLGLCLLLAPARQAFSADDASLSIKIGEQTDLYATSDLLARDDLVTITVPMDPAYGQDMTYKAVPLANLLKDKVLPPGEFLESAALDGFQTPLPIELVNNTDPSTSVPYVAVEDPSAPWPQFKDGSPGAGPFYLVWLNPEANEVRDQFWPFQLASVSNIDAPSKQWPDIGTDPSLAQTDPVRAGEQVFSISCIACHKLNGAGNGDAAPALTASAVGGADGIQKALDDPKHVEALKDKVILSKREITLVTAYLGNLAAR